MGFKDVINRMNEKRNARKELLDRMSDQVRLEKIVSERQLSSNERELLRYLNEDREANIKDRLEFARKKRSDDISFGHNPLDAENIITKPHWEVLKEKSQFSGKGTIFEGSESIMKNNPNLLKSNKKLLKSNDKLMKGGNMFKI